MSDPLHALAADSDRIHAQYRRGFAGRSRYTRDLVLLDSLLQQTRELVTKAAATPGADVELSPVLAQRVALYQGEREQIAAVQAGGPDEGVAHRTGSWTRLARQRYARNFAGQNRLSRDLGLLQAMATDQRRWLDLLRAAAARHDSDWHAEDIQQMQSNIALFDGEMPQIRDARAKLEAGRQAQVLGTLANNQLAAWRLHFQGRPRRSRRAALLRRMVTSLEQIHAQMLALQQQGLREDFHQRNLEILAERLPVWRQEIAQIDQARGQAGPDAVLGALGEDANTWFQRFRAELAGKPYTKLDLEGLAQVCEGLTEVGLAMEDHHTTWQRPRNAQNLDIVLENLKAYEREFERAKDAQKPA
ncbi:MAG: hypothetical protein GXP62_00685 [Oligoflexia bacterium]|nr:hypothetical protein [Oligoflexia bacterium]